MMPLETEPLPPFPSMSNTFITDMDHAYSPFSPISETSTPSQTGLDSSAIFQFPSHNSDPNCQLFPMKEEWPITSLYDTETSSQYHSPSPSLSENIFPLSDLNPTPCETYPSQFYSEYSMPNYDEPMMMTPYYPPTSDDLNPFFDLDQIGTKSESEYSSTTSSIYNNNSNNYFARDNCPETPDSTSTGQDIENQTPNSFVCLWMDCNLMFDSQRSLVDHVNESHVESAKKGCEERPCLWKVSLNVSVNFISKCQQKVL